MWWRPVLVALALVAGCSDSPDDPAADTAAHPTSVASTAPPTTGAPASTVATTVSTTAPSTTALAGGIPPAGFDRVAARITAADGGVCDVCVWLAATPGQRAQGLMGVTDLSGADGMLFAWDEPTSGGFWMRDTPLPLSIAFFAADGSFVSAADMTPCLDPTPDAECARYVASGAYTHAIEVAAGGLPALLIGPGSRLEVLGGPCPLAAG